MDKEERAFRRMIARAVVAGPERLTREEIHASLGIGKNMVADARKAEKEDKMRMTEARVAGRRLKSRLVTSALERHRKTTKFAEMRQKVKAFYIAKSTPTSRRRDVLKCWVSLKFQNFSCTRVSLSLCINTKFNDIICKMILNNAGYTATKVACG